MLPTLPRVLSIFVLLLLFLIAGMYPAADPVTVNGTAAQRQGEFFHGEVNGANNNGPDWKSVSVVDGAATKSGALLIPPATQTPQYDADGNLTSDGVYGYSWDGENRLIKIETLAASVTAGVPYQRVECVYDCQWRKVKRTRFNQAAATTPVESTRYLWAGWRCLAEINAADALAKTLVWGLDQQQTLNLGDGNGALLWTNDHVSGESHFFQYDGNGNVVGLSDASGVQTAEYRYGVFGELVEKRGSDADANLYRYSTKPFEEVGGLYYYGYRYLSAAHGRWLSQDPLGEAGGLNLYGMVGNNPVDSTDMLGLYDPFQFSLMDNLRILGAGFRSYAYEATIGTVKDIGNSTKRAANGYMGLLQLLGNTYGNEAWRMTEDWNRGGLDDWINGVGDRFGRSLYDLGDPGFLKDINRQLEDFLARNLNDLECRDKLMHRIRGDLGLSLITLGYSQWAEGVTVFGGSASSLTEGAVAMENIAAKGPPKPSPKFQPPTNPPQMPPENLPPGYKVLRQKPTEQYPNGNWKILKDMGLGSKGQRINPSTMKPGPHPETHVEFPPDYTGPYDY